MVGHEDAQPGDVEAPEHGVLDDAEAGGGGTGIEQAGLAEALAGVGLADRHVLRAAPRREGKPAAGHDEEAVLRRAPRALSSVPGRELLELAIAGEVLQRLRAEPGENADVRQRRVGVLGAGRRAGQVTGAADDFDDGAGLFHVCDLLEREGSFTLKVVR